LSWPFKVQWTEAGTQAILSLRALLLNVTRCNQLWHKIEQFGMPNIASY
jgi:hypothetical protein